MSLTTQQKELIRKYTVNVRPDEQELARIASLSDEEVMALVNAWLSMYIALRKAELDMLKTTMDGLTAKQNSIITELSNLIPTENV